MSCQWNPWGRGYEENERIGEEVQTCGDEKTMEKTNQLHVVLCSLFLNTDEVQWMIHKLFQTCSIVNDQNDVPKNDDDENVSDDLEQKTKVWDA